MEGLSHEYYDKRNVRYDVNAVYCVLKDLSLTIMVSAPLFTALVRYTILYNGNRIIRVLFEPDTPVAIAAGTALHFTYEVLYGKRFRVSCVGSIPRGGAGGSSRTLPCRSLLGAR